MNTVRMWMVLSLVQSAAALSTVIAAEVPVPRHWVNAAKKRVDYVPSATLKVVLAHNGGNDETWDSLSLDLGYGGTAGRSQFEALQAKYPGYEIRRAVLSRRSNYVVSIPSLGIQETIETKAGIEGPYFQYSAFIPKSKSERVRLAVQNDEAAVQVSGELTAQLPVNRVIERKELGEAVCEELVRGGVKVGDVLLKLPHAFARAEGLGARYPSTVMALKRSILNQCLELESNDSIRSFKELLEISVSRKGGARLVGETWGEVPEATAVPLAYVSERQVTK